MIPDDLHELRNRYSNDLNFRVLVDAMAQRIVAIQWNYSDLVNAAKLAEYNAAIQCMKNTLGI